MLSVSRSEVALHASGALDRPSAGNDTLSTRSTAASATETRIRCVFSRSASRAGIRATTVHRQILGIAGMLSDGIAAQFLERFQL